MSLVSTEGRIDVLPIEVQEVVRDLAKLLNDLSVRHGRGEGDPDGVVIGYKGYTWERTDGGAGTCFYVFEGTDGSETGWVAK